MMLLLIAGVLLATGCGASQDGQAGGAGTTSEPTATTDPTDTSTQPPTLAPGVPSPTVSLPLPPPPTGGEQVDVPAALMDQIRADAAGRAGIAPSAVQVVSSTMQTWSDGSLGCPRPGEAYIQVQVDGYQVFVQAGGRTYDYRTSHNAIRLCEK